ncbi:MAG: helix-turn-helix domain-containing protein [Allomuricauda sp.]
MNKKTGRAHINFQPTPVKGIKAIALCPNEVLHLQDVKDVVGISFGIMPNFLMNRNFLQVFGNPKKAFEVKKAGIISASNFLKNLIKRFKTEDYSVEENIHFLLSTVKINEVSNLEDLAPFQFIVLVHLFYKSEHRLQFYSKMIGYTTKHIATVFEKNGFKTPHFYIKSRLIQEAKRLLVFTNLSVSHICYDIGFNEPAYFTRFFKKEMDMTPTSFRKQWKNKKYQLIQ